MAVSIIVLFIKNHKRYDIMLVNSYILLKPAKHLNALKGIFQMKIFFVHCWGR